LYKWVVDMEFTKFAGPGRTAIAGAAWAQPRGIAKVEVRADSGAWVQAKLATEVNLVTWRMWMVELDLAPGLHTVQCRATDKAGYTQTDQRVAPVPDGATGWHSTTFTVQG
jgi:hypothetical protein